MDPLSRLNRCLAAVCALGLALFGAADAWAVGAAEVQIESQAIYSVNGVATPDPQGDSYGSACAAASAIITAQAQQTYKPPAYRSAAFSMSSCDAGGMRGKVTFENDSGPYSDPPHQWIAGNEGNVTFPIGRQTFSHCPSGAHPTGGSDTAPTGCECNTGTYADATHQHCGGRPIAEACRSTIDTVVDTEGDQTLPVKDNATTASACSNGCEFSPRGSSNPIWLKLGSQWFYSAYSASFKGTGVACSTEPPVPADAAALVEPPPNKVPAGKCPGTVNGMAVVVDCDSTSGAAPVQPTSATGPSSTASSPPGTIPGTTSTEGTTTCTGSVCVTTYTTRVNNADGTTTTTQSNGTQDKGALCAATPTAAVCEAEKSSFAGACGAPVACKGDAVQCQIATEQLKRDCENYSPNAASARGLAAAVAGDQPGDHPANSGTTVEVGSGAFDTTDIIGGSCPSDQVINVLGGQAVTLPFSKLCTPAQWLGNILMAISAIACAGIVIKGV